MAKNTAIIRAGTLLAEISTDGKHLEIPAESGTWFAWLQTAETFVFDDPSGHFTARKKHRLGGEYWYAFRRYGGRLYETYLGKSRDVTLGRLRKAAAKLNQTAEPSPQTETALPVRARSNPAEGSAQSIAYRSFAYTSAAQSRAQQIRVSHLVRTRAVERVEQVTTCPLTIVSAPAGYGKSTLVAQWVTLSHLPAAWLTLDEHDNDPVLFWSHACAVLAQLRPDLFESVRRSARASASQRDHVLLTALIETLAKAPTAIIIVLDDYHEIEPDNVAIHASVAYFIEHLPSHVHVIVASRTIPPLSLAKLRAGQQLLEFYADDLQFTLAETRAFLSGRMHLHLSDGEVTTLQERTEGWIAALQLAALSLQEQPDVATWVAEFNGENRHVFDYLIEEVLNSLAPETQTFVLQMSVLARFSASLCDAVTLSSNGQAMLADLERANLFLVPLDDRREWYRLHQLFADALRRYARMTQPALVPELYHRASYWCESHGMTLDAIDYAFEAGELERAAQLVEGYVPVALAKDYRVVLLERLNRLPDHLVRERPRLCVAHAYTLFMSGGERALMRQRVRDAEESLALTEHRFEPADLAILRGEVLALRTSIRHLLSGEMGPRQLLPLFQQALAALPRHHWLRSFITLFIGMEQFVDGDVRASARTLEALMHASEAQGNAFYVAMSALYLGLALLQQGRLDDALACCSQTKRCLTGNPDADLMARVQMIIGKVCVERNDLARAVDCLGQGISLRYDPAPFFMEAFSALAYAHLALGDRAAAKQTIEQGRAEWMGMQAENMTVWAWTGRQIQAHQARLWLLEGDLEAASTWARSLERDRETATGNESGPPTYVREWEDIVLARVYLGEHRTLDARALLERLGAVAEAEGRKSRLLEILVLQGVTHDALDNTPAAMLALQRAVELAAPQQIVRPFVEGGAVIQRLLMLLRAEHTRRSANVHVHARPHRQTALPRYVESLLAAFTLQHRDGDGDGDALKRLVQTGAAYGRDSSLVLLMPTLTPRERQIMRLLANGATNKEIATDLVISEATVKRHVSNILMALDVRNRMQAVARAREFHLLDYESENKTVLPPDREHTTIRQRIP